MDDVEVGMLILQKKSVYFEDPDIGIVIEVKNREEHERYVEIYWIRQGKFTSYLHFELSWFTFGGEESNWKIYK